MQTRSLCNHSWVEHKPIAAARAAFFPLLAPASYFALLFDWVNELSLPDKMRLPAASISYGCTVVLLELYVFSLAEHVHHS